MVNWSGHFCGWPGIQIIRSALWREDHPQIPGPPNMLIKKKWFIIGLNWNHWTDFAKFPPLSAQPAANSPPQCPIDNVPVCSGHGEFQCGFIQARAPDSSLPSSWREKDLVHSLPHQNSHWRSLAMGTWPIGCSLWGCESWINASNIAVQWLLTRLLGAVALTTIPAAWPRLAPAHVPSHVSLLLLICHILSESQRWFLLHAAKNTDWYVRLHTLSPLTLLWKKAPPPYLLPLC